MVKQCSISTCKCQYTPSGGITYHAFPTKDAARLKQWIEAIPPGLINKITTSTYVCSQHFLPENYHNTPLGRNVLKRDAVPTCFQTSTTDINVKIHQGGIAKRSAEQNVNDNIQNVRFEDEENILPKVSETSPKRLTPSSAEEILSPNKTDASTQTSPKRLKPTQREETLMNAVNNLQKCLNRRDKKIKNLKEILKALKETSTYSEGIHEILQKHFSDEKLELLLNEVNNNDVPPNRRHYSDAIKQFALTVHFYSPKAYEVLRKYLYLPHSATIRQWMSIYDCEPGLLTQVLNYLEAATKTSSHLRNVSLVFDAMALHAEYLYDVANDMHTGYVNYGGLIKADSDKLATQALVFQIVSYTDKFKCPVAYVLTTGPSAAVQADLLKQIIVKLYHVGTTVRSITCDGTGANFSTYKYLGCDFSSENLDELVTSFRHPCSETKIHCILDPPHMGKLCRNTVGDIDDIESESGKISFQFIRALHRIQEEQDLTLANKLSAAHMYWKRKKMKVSLAVQTISSAVADAIDYLRACKQQDFENSEATTEFIRIFDRLFDMMNARNCQGKGFKSPLRPRNLQYFKNVFAESRAYISALKIEGVRALEHGRKTFALGFAINTHSFINLAEDLFQLPQDPLTYFLPYKCSQDHIELMFCCIRSRGGWNNNPNCLQFKWALRQLLFRNRVEPSSNANCAADEMDIIPILEFRSEKRSLSNPTVQTDSKDEELENHLSSALDRLELSALQKNILYYITGHIVHSLINKIACEDCKSILLAEQNRADDHCYSIDINKHSSFVSFISRGGLVFPSNAAFNIVVLAEKSFQAELNVGLVGKPNLKQNMITTVMQKLMSNNSIYFDKKHPINNMVEGEDLHEIQLIKALVSSYANLRIKSHAKKMTQRHVGKRINDRQHLHNTILFYNI